MTGLNAPSLQLRATWQTAYTGGAKLLDALRMMTSISPQAAGATALLTSAAKDVTAQLIGFGKESGATRAELLQMVQEVNPGHHDLRRADEVAREHAERGPGPELGSGEAGHEPA